MSERYSKVFALSENLYATGAPIVIEAGALQKDNQTGGILAQIKMKNISAKVIKAVKVKLTLFDVAGNILADGVEQQYLDLRVVRDESFGSKSAIKLKESTTRSFAVNIIEVVFDDGSVWNGTANPWETLSEPISLINHFNDEELVKQYELTYGAPCHNVLLEEKDLWHCACGAINKDNEEKCHKCGKSLKALKELDISALKSEKEKRLEAERIAAEEQAEREREEAEIAKNKSDAIKKRSLKIAAIVVPVVCVLFIGIFGFKYTYNNIIIPNGQYNEAMTLKNEGKYREAINAFEALSDYKDSKQQIQECENLQEQEYQKVQEAALENKYIEAIDLVNKGAYSRAISAFEALGKYKDSEEQIVKIKDTQYDNAMVLMKNSQYVDAAAILEGLNGHKDSLTQLNSILDDVFKEKISTLNVGDKITLGSYPQKTGDLNQKSPIEWRILKKTGDKALLFSTYILDYKEFDDTKENVSWEKSSLRSWLNTSFYSNAFTTEERKVITISPTQDNVFLLSADEINATTDPYAKQGVVTSYFKSKGNFGQLVTLASAYSYFLRTVADDYVYTVSYDGETVLTWGTAATYKDGVRPAIWVSLD